MSIQRASSVALYRRAATAADRAAKAARGTVSWPAPPVPVAAARLLWSALAAFLTPAAADVLLLLEGATSVSAELLDASVGTETKVEAADGAVEVAPSTMSVALLETSPS